MEGVEVVLANNDRVTLRAGDVFLKVDADQARADREVEAMTLAPVPTPEILWREPPVLAMAALAGSTIGRLGEPSTASPGVWKAAGATIRALHDAPLPPWSGTGLDDRGARLGSECDRLITEGILPAEVVRHNQDLAKAALRPRPPAFIHGDLHLEHVFADGDVITGIIDWSEAGPGDPLFDLASFTLGHEDHLDDVLDGYGSGIDRDLIRSWQSLRCLTAVRWLIENGYGEADELPEVAILRSRLADPG